MCQKKVLVFLLLLIGCSGESDRENDFADEDGQLLSSSLKSFCEAQKTKAGYLLTSFYELKIATRLRPFAYYLCESHENLLKEIYSEEFVNDNSVFGSRIVAIRDELQMTNGSSPDCAGRERFLAFIEDLIQIKYGFLPKDLLKLERLDKMLRSVEPVEGEPFPNFNFTFRYENSSVEPQPSNLKFIFRYENSTVFYWLPLVMSSKFVYNTNRMFFDTKASASLEFSLMIPLFDERYQANAENCVKAEDLPDSIRDGLKLKKFNGTIEAPEDETKNYSFVDVLYLDAFKTNRLRKEDLPQSAFELRSLCENRKINDTYLTNSYYRLDLWFRGFFSPSQIYFPKYYGAGAPANKYNLTEVKIRCKNFAEHFKSLRKKMYSEAFMEKSSNMSEAIAMLASELDHLKSKWLDLEDVKHNRTEPGTEPGYFEEEPFYVERLNYKRLKAYLDELDSYVQTSRLESISSIWKFDLEQFLRLYAPLPDHVESTFRNESSFIFKTQPLVLFDKMGLDGNSFVKDPEKIQEPLHAYFSLFFPMYDKKADFTDCVPPKRLPKFFVEG